jgi:hypothetical protein
VSAYADHGDGDHYWTVSGKRGRFILDTTSKGYPERGYQVSLLLCGTRRNVSPEYYRHADSYETLTDVVVHAGHTTHLDFVLRTGAAVTGMVTDVDGHPLVDGCVWTREWGEPQGTTYDDMRVAYTDASGRYRMNQLVPGPHRFAAYRHCGDQLPIAVSGGLHAWPGGHPVEIGEGQTRVIDLSFWDGGPARPLAPVGARP